MTQRLIRAIHEALTTRWFARLPGVILRAKDLVRGTSPAEAYGEGYRQGYWDAVVDLAESDLLKDPTQTKRVPVPQPWLEEYH